MFRNGRVVTVSVGAADVAIQTTKVPICDEGILVEAKIKIPDTDNNRTFTFSILDQDGDTRYSIAALAENASTLVFPNRIIRQGFSFGMTPSDATGNAISVTIDPTYEV